MISGERFNSIDLADLIETENEGEAGLIADLIRDFAAQLEAAIQEMDTAQAAGQFRELERFAHSLKSSSRLLGLRASSVICEEIEDKAHDGSFDPNCLGLLRAEIFPAVEELKQFETTRRAAGSH